MDRDRNDERREHIMKMEEHFRDTLERAVANEPPVINSWTTFERRVRRDRGVRVFGSVAAILAVLVAAVIVVPRLGRTPGIVLNPPESPSLSPSPTVDRYPGWETFENKTENYRLRYPSDWRIASFEAVYEVVPKGLPDSPAGSVNTFAVALTVLPETYDDPGGPGPSDGYDRLTGTRSDGRPYVRLEKDFGEGNTRRVEYHIEWSSCIATTSKCSGRPTLFLIIEAGRDLWDEYKTVAEQIAASVEYIGA